MTLCSLALRKLSLVCLELAIQKLPPQLHFRTNTFHQQLQVLSLPSELCLAADLGRERSERRGLGSCGRQQWLEADRMNLLRLKVHQFQARAGQKDKSLLSSFGKL